LRNKALLLFQHYLQENEKTGTSSLAGLNWLERVLKVLEKMVAKEVDSLAHFSPGEACRQEIVRLLGNAKSKIDICVFTISDNILAREILAAHTREIKVRIISDNEKIYDRGSDIHFLEESGVKIRKDAGPNHMHHKFAIFDNEILLNGSFNWTRSASERNHENIAVHYQNRLISEYTNEFEKLWNSFERN